MMISGRSAKVLCLIGVLITLVTGCLLVLVWINTDYHFRFLSFLSGKRIISLRLRAAIDEFRLHEDEWKFHVPKIYITDIKSGYVRAKMMRERCSLFKQFSKDESILRQGRFTHSFLSIKNMSLNICTNAKVASSTIRSMIYFIANNKRPSKISQRKFREFTSNLFAKQFSEVPDYTNVTFIRDPLERLLSAYLDEKAFVRRDKSMSFFEFLRLVLNEGIAPENVHLQSYTLHCRVCDSHFSYIGLQNTFDKDIRVILKERGVDHNQYKTGRRRFRNSDDKLKQYYNQIPNSLIHSLWEMYFIDYFIFGFAYPSHLFH